MGNLTRVSAIILLWAILLVNTGGQAAKALGEDLYDAAIKGDLPAVQRLAGRGPQCKDVNTATHNGNANWTPLIAAAFKNQTQVVKFLLESCKSDMNIQDFIGRTALYLAAQYNNKEIFKLLLQNGADATIKSNDGDTAGDRSLQHGFMDRNLMYTLINTETKNRVKLYTDANTDTNNRVDSLFVIVICLSVVVCILVITIIGGGVYFMRYKHSVQTQHQQHAVVFTNEQNKQSLHIYEN
ncbi:unnamed protein product [Meganyctiphanes norvegica]|uniref:Ankyrin repeat domain-containing protein n=1 Tax=Meganyctiphanes norvegica TaxID=48144 RepID=A0AAV2PVW4_MEGNR